MDIKIIKREKKRWKDTMKGWKIRKNERGKKGK
jgi:hypothetical protein